MKMETENTNWASPAVTTAEPGKPAKASRKWRLLLVPAGAILVLIGWQSSHGKPTPIPEAEATVTVPVAKVARENLTRNRTFEAEFRPYQTVDLHANVAGFVQSINVDIGDRVHAGDVLAVLSIPELKEDVERAAATELRDEKKVLQATAAHDDAHLTRTRLASIDQAKPHLVAKQDLDTALAKDLAAEAALAAAEQDVQVSRAEINKLEAIRDYCKITAPFSGVITKRYADEGALIQGGVSPSGAAMPLVRLAQNEKLRLDFPISVSYVQYIKVGDPVEIRILGTGQTITGKISRFTRDVDMATRTMETEVDVANPDLAITPGVYAEVSLRVEDRKNTLAVPASALSSLKSPTAMVLTADNKVEERPLKLGLATADKFEVLSGLNENDLVIVGSRANVRPGQKVEPKLMETGGLP